MPSSRDQSDVAVGRRTAPEKLEVTEDDQPIPVARTRYVQGGCQISRKQPGAVRFEFTLGLRCPRIPEPSFGTFPWIGRCHGCWNGQQSSPRIEQSLIWMESTQSCVIWLYSKRIQPSPDMLFARADVLFRLGHNELAISSFSQVSESAARLGYPSIAFDAAHKYFVAFMDSGLIDDADLVLHKAKAFIRSGAIGPEVQWNYDAGQIYYLTGRLADAELAPGKRLFNAERLDVGTSA